MSEPRAEYGEALKQRLARLILDMERTSGNGDIRVIFVDGKLKRLVSTFSQNECDNPLSIADLTNR